MYVHLQLGLLIFSAAKHVTSFFVSSSDSSLETEYFLCSLEILSLQLEDVSTPPRHIYRAHPPSYVPSQQYARQK